MGIRIDPSYDLVWRDPHTVQIGVDPPCAVVNVPTTAQERFLLALRRETPRDALQVVAAQYGCGPDAAATVIGELGPALAEVVPAPEVRVEVHGSGPIADAVAEYLAGERVRVTRTDSPFGGPVTVPVPAPDLAVVVADHVVDPAVRSSWIRRDVPHVPVVVGDRRVRIGPVLEAESGPCLHCVELARADEDPSWPVIAGQVWGRAAPTPTRWEVAVVAATVVALVTERLQDGVARVDERGGARQLRMDRSDRTITATSLWLHPECGCRALPGNGSVAGLRLDRGRAPT